MSEWIHVFEEDTGEGLVFRPRDYDVPLSRRPRERLILKKDGSAELFSAGPDDRPAKRKAKIEIVDRARDRLVVKVHEHGDG